ncbi:hypothetical protein GCM10027276_23660 [Comamonas piscis]
MLVLAVLVVAVTMVVVMGVVVLVHGGGWVEKGQAQGRQKRRAVRGSASKTDTFGVGRHYAAKRLRCGPHGH